MQVGQISTSARRLAGDKRLMFVVGVVGPVGQDSRRVQLAVRGAQPALGDRDVGIERALEGHLRPPGSKTRTTRKRSASAVVEETKRRATPGQ